MGSNSRQLGTSNKTEALFIGRLYIGSLVYRSTEQGGKKPTEGSTLS